VKFSSDKKLQIQGNEITISIRSAPERGRANSELVKLLARHFRVEPGRVRIVSGLKSRKKLVEIL
jgi:uncharacterized protein (TIGR00251 family)